MVVAKQSATVEKEMQIASGYSSATPYQDYHTRYTTTEDEGDTSEPEEVSAMDSCTTRQLLSRANLFPRSISG